VSAAVLALVVALVGLRKPAQAVKLEMRGDRCRADEWNGRARFAQRKRRGFCLRTGHQSMLTQMKLSSVWLMAPRKPSWTVAAWPLPSSAATSASRSIYRGARAARPGSCSCLPRAAAPIVSIVPDMNIIGGYLGRDVGQSERRSAAEPARRDGR
jgi:hypothetical protein